MRTTLLDLYLSPLHREITSGMCLRRVIQHEKFFSFQLVSRFQLKSESGMGLSPQLWPVQQPRHPHSHLVLPAPRPGAPAANASAHVHLKPTRLLYSVLYSWISICYMYLF